MLPRGWEEEEAQGSQEAASKFCPHPVSPGSVGPMVLQQASRTGTSLTPPHQDTGTAPHVMLSGPLGRAAHQPGPVGHTLSSPHSPMVHRARVVTTPIL